MHEILLEQALVVIMEAADVRGGLLVVLLRLVMCVLLLLLLLLLLLGLLGLLFFALLLSHTLTREVEVLSRYLSQRLQGREALLGGREGQAHGLAALHGAGRRLLEGGKVGQLVDLQQGALPVAQRESGAFFDEVVREAIYTALGELGSVSRLVSCGGTKNAVGFTDCSSHLFTAALARVLVAITCILEFRPALEEF